MLELFLPPNLHMVPATFGLDENLFQILLKFQVELSFGFLTWGGAVEALRAGRSAHHPLEVVRPSHSAGGGSTGSPRRRMEMSAQARNSSCGPHPTAPPPPPRQEPQLLPAEGCCPPTRSPPT
jgi:hypothetical protein